MNKALTIALCALSLAACRSIDAQVPEGFARYESQSERHASSLRAVSPEGVVFRVRREKTTQAAELAFWKAALKKRMLDAGYHFVSATDITARGGPAHVLELAAPLGSRDYGYRVALFAKEKDLLIAEAAGEVLHLKKHKKAIDAAFASITH